jgi:NAD(P)-dependent dehydrogenase (short-subunit alcohol dehydrogenase family)
MTGSAAPLGGRRAFVAGAGRGIGRAIAVAFARAGADLVLVARTAAELDDARRACEHAGGAAETLVVDVLDWEQVERAVAAAGRIDVLVNSAGIYGPIGPAVEADPADWRRGVEVNLFGAFHLCRAVLPQMVERRSGKILLLGGGGATQPLPAFSSYAAAKAGVARLADTIAAEVENSNVQVNVIAPGLVDTRLQDDVLAAGERSGPLLEKVREARQSGSGAVAPELAAELAVFLASDASGALTGKVVSAPHDPWREWTGADRDLNASSLFTIRRLDPFTIGPLLAQAQAGGL